ncbi:MAG: ABC transporter permease subunit, partial [Halobacteriaceae archaeon]
SEQFFGITWENWLVDTRAVTGNPPLNNLHKPENLLAATKKILPAALVLGSASMGNELRIGRTAVLETLNEQYIETAKAKGVSGRVLVWKHIFRNALIPLVPIITSE